jgi:hypothetical protein
VLSDVRFRGKADIQLLLRMRVIGCYPFGPSTSGLHFLVPEIPKPSWTQFRVPDRVLNVFVAQVGLQRPCVVPSIR